METRVAFQRSRRTQDCLIKNAPKKKKINYASHKKKFSNWWRGGRAGVSQREGRALRFSCHELPPSHHLRRS